MTPASEISREEFMDACAALWSELQYQNTLPRRTKDEATDVPGFATLGRVYLRKLEDVWSSIAGEVQEDGSIQVPEALHGLRKITAIFVRAMIYNGVRCRETPPAAPFAAVAADLIPQPDSIPIDTSLHINWNTPSPEITMEGLRGVTVAGAIHDFTLEETATPFYRTEASSANHVAGSSAGTGLPE